MLQNYADKYGDCFEAMCSVSKISSARCRKKNAYLPIAAATAIMRRRMNIICYACAC